MERSRGMPRGLCRHVVVCGARSSGCGGERGEPEAARGPCASDCGPAPRVTRAQLRAGPEMHLPASQDAVYSLRRRRSLEQTREGYRNKTVCRTSDAANGAATLTFPHVPSWALLVRASLALPWTPAPYTASHSSLCFSM